MPGMRPGTGKAYRYVKPVGKPAGGSCGCGATWASSDAAHCPTCHETWPSVGAFDGHRCKR